MAEKKEKVLKKMQFEGEIVFQSLDMYVCRLKDTTVEVQSTEKFEIGAKHLPADFDATKHTVVGEVVRTIRVIEKE